MIAAMQLIFDSATTQIYDPTDLKDFAVLPEQGLQSGQILGRLQATDLQNHYFDGVTMTPAPGFVLENGMLRVAAQLPLPGEHQLTFSFTDAGGVVTEQTIMVTIPEWSFAIPNPSADGDAVESSGIPTVFVAGPGDDTITADFTFDVVQYSGNRADYLIELVSAGGGGGYGGYGSYGGTETPETWRVTDLRPGGPDGVDLVIGTGPRLSFADMTVNGEILAGADQLTVDGRLMDRDIALAENTAIGTVIGQLGLTSGEGTITLVDYEIRAITPFLTLDIRPDLFSISETGEITVSGIVDFEEYVAIGIHVTYLDDGVLRSDNVRVDPFDVPEPAFALFFDHPEHNVRIVEHENDGAAVLVGQVTLADMDAPPGGHVMSVSDPRFEVIGPEIYLKAGAVVDFETEPVLTLEITVTESGSGVVTSFPVTIPVVFAAMTGTAATDGILGSGGGDVIFGGSGDDMLRGAQGNDTILGGDGADIVIGGRGDDVIHGDGETRQRLHWADHAGDLGGFEAAVGAYTLTGSVTPGAAMTQLFVTNGTQYVEPVDELDPNSGVAMTGGFGTAAVVDVSLSREGAAAEVQGVVFRLSDLDANIVTDILGGVFINWRNRVQVQAFDAAGNALAVHFSAGDEVQIGAGQVFGTGAGDRDPSSELVSALVTVLGPVHRLVVTSVNDGSSEAVAIVSDLVFLTDDGHAAGGGNDSLSGGEGNDILQGGMGDDLLTGNAGFDIARYVGDADAVVSLVTRAAQDTGHGMDTLVLIEGIEGGNGNDSLTGNGQDNLLSGGAGRDTLTGGNGADTLMGGAGRDILRGGGGDDLLTGGGDGDVFVFRLGGGDDVVMDFEHGLDRLRLDIGLVDGAATAAAVLARFGMVDGIDLVLDFGADSLRFKGMGLVDLAGDIGLFSPDNV